MLARAKLRTLVVEARDSPGGGARSEALTLPGFVHDVCSSVHPLGVGSPFFRTLPLERHGLRWIEPSAPLAHVLDEERVILLERSIAATAKQLGNDGEAYSRLLTPFTNEFDALARMILGPLRPPERPALLARFGLVALRSMRGLALDRFQEPLAPALLAGMAAHAMLPLSAPASASFALVLAIAGHARGWPIARGGSQALTDALVAHYLELGGEIVLGRPVRRLDDLPKARAYLLDLAPRQIARVAGDRLPRSYLHRLQRFRYGPGVYKLDWALAAPVPWRNPDCARAGTVHLAGSFTDVARAEAAVHAGTLDEQPFVLLVQPSLFDPSRAPAGAHTLWAYCHVPHGSGFDAADAVERRIERFAPGFKERVLARSTKNALEMEVYNPNYVGGDINGGLADLQQLFFRPVLRLDPYSTPAPDVFVCSSSTPPGGGVHGMCGFWAARSALTRCFGVSVDLGT